MPISSGRRLWTKGKRRDTAGYVGGNAATLLAIMGTSFQNADLEDAVLLDADLSNTNFCEGNLKNAVLCGARLFNATLDRADCRHSDMTDIGIGELGGISCLAWSDDGDYLAIGGEDCNVRLVDYVNGKFVRTFRGHGATVVDMTFIPDTRLLLTVAKNVMIWDIEESRVVAANGLNATFEYEGIFVEGGGAFINITATEAAFHTKLATFRRGAFYSNVPRFTVEVSDNGIVIRDWSRSGESVFCAGAHDSGITTACFSPTDMVIAVGTEGRKVYVWNTSTGDLLSVLEDKPVSCKDMQIEGARGITNARGYAIENDTRSGTLAEWLIERGAYWPEVAAIIMATKNVMSHLAMCGENGSRDY